MNNRGFYFASDDNIERGTLGFGVVLIVIVVALLGLAAGGFFYWKQGYKLEGLYEKVFYFSSKPKKGQGSDVKISPGWKVYRNEVFGFEFQYPVAKFDDPHPSVALSKQIVLGGGWEEIPICLRGGECYPVVVISTSMTVDHYAYGMLKNPKYSNNGLNYFLPPKDEINEVAATLKLIK